MECARKHLGKGLENASEGGRSTGERDGFPLGIRIGGRVRHSELVGAMSRDSCKYIAQLPRGLAKGMGAGPAPHGGHSLEENREGNHQRSLPRR